MEPKSDDVVNAAASTLLTEEEAAARLKVQPSTLTAWRLRGHPDLPFVRVGRCVRYRPQDIAAFIASHVRRSTGKARA